MNAPGATAVVVDTDVMIDFLRGYSEARQELEHIGFDNVLLSTPTLLELYAGCRDKQELARFNRQLPRFAVVHLTEPVCELALHWGRTYCLSHSPIDLTDLFNAAIANLGGISVHTYNVKDYHYLPGVQLHAF